MRSTKPLALIGLAAIALTGCSTAPMSLNYSPSSTLIVEGSTTIGDFTYGPALSGEVEPNQIRNTAVGNIYFEKNIDKIFEEAVFNESRLMGVDIQGKHSQLSGNIVEFLIDDLGYSIDWEFSVNYVVHRAGETCYEQVHTITRSGEKFGNPLDTLKEVVKLNIEAAYSDPAFVDCISS